MTEIESGRCRVWGSLPLLEEFVVKFRNLEVVFGLSSQQQTDTQERREDRQLGLVTSEGEVHGRGRRRTSFEGSMTPS